MHTSLDKNQEPKQNKDLQVDKLPNYNKQTFTIISILLKERIYYGTGTYLLTLTLF